MSRTAIIAALERELHPLVRGWAKTRIECGGQSLMACRSGNVIALAGGIGSRQAGQAARAVMEHFRPQALVSAGFAGSLVSSLKAGSVVTPNIVVDAVTGAEYRCSTPDGVAGRGVLVSAQSVAGPEAKLALAQRFHGWLVDMEAAGVAGVAGQFNVEFRCVKAISDELDFALPPFNQFVDADGNFRGRDFLVWAAPRPQHWLAILRLARNTRRAAQALCDWLRDNVVAEVPAGPVGTLDKRDLPRPRAR